MIYLYHVETNISQESVDNMIIKKSSNYTRKINPKLGLFGLLGLLGFTGFIQDIQSIPFSFIFFAFFGFFGFYYEGKMSETLIDERFELNSYRASAIANRIALIVILGISLMSMTIFKIRNPYNMLSLLISTIGISWALSTFLHQYLLYRFENEE